MYLDFYNLEKKPFQISVDPDFLWLGEKHEEALATLKYGVLDNKGFLLITGDVGTGKTTLVRTLVRGFDRKVIHATVPDPGFEKIEFFNTIARAFRLPRRFETKGDFIAYFTRFLHLAASRGKTTVLIIDEAQRLSQELLEEIRLLSNIEKEDRKLLNIFFLGQNEFDDILARPENRALRQRITLRYYLEPLSADETGLYIRHRLQVAGASGELFTTRAMREIYAFSKGYPRLINIVCDHALLTGYANGKKPVDRRMVRECRRDLEGEGSRRRRATDAAGGSPAPAAPAGDGKTPRSMWRRLSSAAVVTLLFLLVAGVLFRVYHLRHDPLSSLTQEIEALKARVGEPSGKKGRSEQPAPAPAPVSASGTGQTAATASAAPPAAAPAPPAAVDNGSAGTAEEPDEASEDKEAPLADLKSFMAENGGRLVVFFPYNSNAVSRQDYRRLDRFARLARQLPDLTVVLTGHTSRAGRADYNRKLSDFRANIVKGYLVGKGLAPEAIEAVGVGPDQPWSGENGTEDENFDRRVEISVRYPSPGSGTPS